MSFRTVVRLLATSATVIANGVGTEAEKKHHNHHRKHHHHKHHDANNNATVVSSEHEIAKSEFHAERANNAAEQAADAAAMTKAIAKQMMDHADAAHEALNHAHKALHEARVESKGLTPEQEKNLRMAEAKLKSATDNFPHSTNPLASEDRQMLQSRVDTLEARLRANNTNSSQKANIQQMQKELDELKRKIANKGEKEKSMEQMDAELAKLKNTLKSLEEAKANTPDSETQIRGELEVEIEHMRDSISKLEKVGVTVKLPRNVPYEPQKAELRYRMKVHRPRPKVQLTPLVNLQEKAEQTAESKDENDSADDDEAPVASGGASAPASKGIDVDTEMPYGELEPFGRENTAQELTEASIRESDAMVDQLERAEVAEEKRAVFRALTRLRGAAITSFDGVARAQTGNIDEYGKVHQWRGTHPLAHLASEEADVAKWAFPDDADF